MARRTLTIEYDLNQDFFLRPDGTAQDADGTLLDYLTNEFDNAGIIARIEEGDTVRLPRTIDRAKRLEALQDAIKRFEDNYKHAVLTPLAYPEPPLWTRPLVRDLHSALEASKGE